MQKCDMKKIKVMNTSVGRWSLYNNCFKTICHSLHLLLPITKASELLRLAQMILMKRNDVDVIISACDFDREGQIIGDTIIYNL